MEEAEGVEARIGTINILGSGGGGGGSEEEEEEEDAVAGWVGAHFASPVIFLM